MLIAKFSPGIQLTKTDLFGQTTVTETYEYMSAHTGRYIIGDTEVILMYKFGTATLDVTGKYTEYVPKKQVTYSLSGTELANWGTNDQYIFNIFAAAKGLTIISFHQPA